jgi:hypothetical protein
MVPNASTSDSWIELNWSLPAGSWPRASWSSSHCHWKNAASNSEVGVS